MRKKQRLLLLVIKMSKSISRMRLVKIMFILSNVPGLSKRIPVYDFVPYKFGPFSFEMYHDLAKFKGKEYVRENNETIHYVDGPEEQLDHVAEELVQKNLSYLDDWDERRLIQEIYKAYPEYTIFSQIEKRQSYDRDETGILTIGYEGLTIDSFINKLIKNKVEVLVDIRKNPISRRYSFSKTRLRENLARFGIKYEHIPKLGIDSHERKGLVTLDEYQRMFARYKGRLGSKNPELINILDLGLIHKIALMCYEADIRYCHRGVISDMIRDRGIGVVDI